MAFTEEFITANGLTTEQVNAVENHYDTEVIPTLRKEYDGVANTNAEGILTGASNAIKSKFGFDLEREKGVKIADYAILAAESFVSKQLAEKQKEIDDKLANFKGGEEYKEQLDILKGEKDLLLQKVAKLEPLSGLDEKYQGATQELSKLKREVAYNSVKPTFPKEVNDYEARAKWDDFKKSIEESYNIELVDGKPIAIDKENEHKRFDLKVLVNQNQDITELLKGRQQSGTGARAVDMLAVEGIPFQVPSNATNEDISNLVREHVSKELGSFTHPKFSSKFAELYTKVKNAKK